jgi:hypothetical protein
VAAFAGLVGYRKVVLYRHRAGFNLNVGDGYHEDGSLPFMVSTDYTRPARRGDPGQILKVSHPFCLNNLAKKERGLYVENADLSNGLIR